MLKNQWEHQEHGVPENLFFIFTIFFGCVTLPQTPQDNVVCPWRMEAAMDPGRFELMSRKELWLVSYERKAVLTFVKKKHPPGQLFHPVGTSLDENSQDPPSVGRSDASRKGSPEHKLFVLTQNIKQYKFSLPPHPLPSLSQLINLGWFINQSPGPSCLSAAHVSRPETGSW